MHSESSRILSIVVPSYNVGKDRYLFRSVPSVLDEQILEDIDVIIVDDGSEDDTAEQADYFVASYPGTIRVIHKENGGHGSAINAGRDAAVGKYFCVLDADDWMNKEELASLVLRLKNCDADIVTFDYDYVTNEGDLLKHFSYDCFPPGKVLEIENCIATIPNSSDSRWFKIHNYCIKTSIMQKYQVTLHEHHFYVDPEYILYSLMHAKTLVYYPLTVRNYMYGTETQSSSIKSKQRNYQQSIDVATYLVDFYNKRCGEMSSNFAYYYRRHIAWYFAHIYSTFLSFPKSANKKGELVEFDNWVSKTCPAVYSENKNRAIAMLRKSNFKLYGIASAVYRQLAPHVKHY